MKQTTNLKDCLIIFTFKKLEAFGKCNETTDEVQMDRLTDAATKWIWATREISIEFGWREADRQAGITGTPVHMKREAAQKSV